MKKDDFLKLVQPNGDYRYGYIESIEQRGSIVIISLFDEGESKIAFDAEEARVVGDKIPDYIGLLTPTEKEVVPLLAQGLSTKQIAVKMDNAPATVRANLRMLRIKCGLDNRAQLMAMAPALDKMIERERNGSERSECKRALALAKT